MRIENTQRRREIKRGVEKRGKKTRKGRILVWLC